MSAIPRTTIEQWVVLRAVVSEGGVVPAARLLNRSQSSVSYALARLRESTGVELMRIEGRRVVLTEAGAALLADAVPLIDELQRIEQRGSNAGRGVRLDMRLLVDTLFPRTRLFAAIERFARDYSDVVIRLRETARLVQSSAELPEYDLGVLVAQPGTDDAATVAQVDLVAVARADHPLAGMIAPGDAALARWSRVDVIGQTAESGKEAGRAWQTNTLEAAVDAVRHGLCYGWLPMHLISEDLNRGSVKRLDLGSRAIRTYRLALSIPEPDPMLDAIAALLRDSA